MKKTRIKSEQLKNFLPLTISKNTTIDAHGEPMKKINYVYIASPYTKGDVAVNVRESLKVGDQLITLGFIPFCPLVSHFQHLLFPRPYEDWLRLDLAWIDRCDALLRLPGESSGADREVAYAKQTGKPIFYSVQELCGCGE